MSRLLAMLLALVSGAVCAQGAPFVGPGGHLTYDTGTGPTGSPILTMRTNKWFINQSRIPTPLRGIDYDDWLPFDANAFHNIVGGGQTPRLTSGTGRPAECNQPWVGATGVNKATFTGYIGSGLGTVSSTTLTVTAISAGTIVPGNPGQVIDTSQLGTGFSGVGVRILSQLTGTTGGVGTYQLDQGFAVPSISWTSLTNACQRNAGNFRTIVGYSKMDFADPIVLFGQAGRSHLHTFFGNTGISPWSTNDGGPRSITNHGNTTASGGTLNRSAYWVPTMIYHCPTTFVDASCHYEMDGLPIIPPSFQIYYKGAMGAGSFVNDGAHDNPWTATHDIVSFPQGFKMLAGNPNATADQSGRIIRFNCVAANQSVRHDGQHIPGTGTGATDTCTQAEAVAAGTTYVGGYMRNSVEFPACWDGVNLDSPTHNDHIHYDVGDGETCGTGYTNQTTGISYQIDYYFTTTGHDAVFGLGLADMPYWRLSSDGYPDTSPAGWSAHGDWFHGWQQTVMDRWVQDCLRPGTDCHDNVAGADPSNAQTPVIQFWRLMRNPRKHK